MPVTLLSYNGADTHRPVCYAMQVDKKKLGEMELDSAGLRQLVKLKTKELANVKKLASVILQKRNEVETFLLESIEMVKVEIGRRRAEEERSRASKGRLPSLPAARPSNLPNSLEERVDIHELTWEDRERVLRLLFSKINNSSPLYPMPPHALQPGDPAPPAAGLSGMMREMMSPDDQGVEHEYGDAFFVTQPAPA